MIMKFNKTRAIAPIFFCFFTLLISLPFSAQADTPKLKPLKVGLILPLSGFVADYGIAVKNAIELAESERSAEERESIEFIYEDSVYDPKVAISSYNKLIDIDGVDLVYSWGTGPSVALAPIAESKQKVLLTLSGEPTVAANKKYVVDSFNRLEDLSAALLSALRAQGFKKFGLVKGEVQYFDSIVDGMKAQLKNDEVLDVIDSFPPEERNNISSSVLKIKTAVSKGKYDIIGVFLVTGQVDLFYKKFQQFNIKVPTFGTDVFLNKDEMKKAGPAAVGAFFATYPTSDDFTAKYNDKYKNDSQLPNAANAYDMINVLYDLFKDNTSEITANYILERLASATPRKGASGYFHYVDEAKEGLPGPGKRFKSDIIIKKVVEGGGSVVSQ